MTAHSSHAGPYSSVAIGSFDGVHLGHRQVLAGCDTVLTFDPHPMQVLTPRRAPCLLTDRPTKLRKLAALGIKRTAIIRFDEAWSHLAGDAFVEGVLLDQLGARIVSIGANFRFGAGGTATPATFADYPSLQTRVVPLVTDGSNGLPISSTRIRQLISRGDVEAASLLLGGPLVLPGHVVSHESLVISQRFAIPAPGEYYGGIDGRPTLVQVTSEGITAAVAGVPMGSKVAVAFLQRND
ncbi:FAD synthetase family protein [Mycolicibacterium cosmeticum]|uniref:FAD synthetase family protein n=2 Tax=Mycobacteriaceae TaxID=1762 RepID=UPI003204977E